MPHVIVKTWTGKTEESKVKLAAMITKAVQEAFGSGEDKISVDIEDVDQEVWTEKVYNPEIKGKWDKLYKKPNY